MSDPLINWLSHNYIELLGAIFGTIYIYFSIKQKILTWPTGLLTSILYVYVFFSSKFYADMSLQLYYVGISIYGWIYWIKGKKTVSTKKVAVTQITKHTLLLLIPITATIYFIILQILLNYTDSPVPYMDSLTTAFSIVATWMLARKIIEHWIIWVFVDLFSAGLYIYKELWPTTILFVIYTGMAVLGYIQWKKDLQAERNE